ncbi:SgcJ/EcaC family oxidoreductase [Actinomadura darangshiensis]|uniref:SgcJ/EcaC family oxidoreductase n=1 Tax=Actinomadura darangshiensis TaxID=705336 RepID=A0A4R5BIW7_9ACTN|nr:SgcJ/EcaC family oxidoreductase [Actinomadura darangshiensis]TDD86531.1 SgcJ/EcaC family oxidoreductase [Actinomadura darangshiensis]
MTTSTSSSSTEQAALAAVPARVVEAWAAHDAGAFAEVFTEDGTMILPGVFREGRAEIAGFMAAAFENDLKGTQVTGTPLHVRLLSDTVGLLITHGGVLAPGETEPSDERAIRASWLLVKQEGMWRLAAYQNTPRDAR